MASGTTPYFHARSNAPICKSYFGTDPKEAEPTSQTSSGYPTEGDIRNGFVYRHVPHVMLKNIANNPDILRHRPGPLSTKR